MGGGPVGASLVHALRDLRVALIGTPADPNDSAASFDPRVYALSPGNVEFLRHLGVWQKLPAERLAAVHGMRIFGDDGHATLEFDAYEAGVPELAWIVEDGALQRALWSGLPGEARQCERLEIGAAARLTLSDGSDVAAKLIVGADGAHSFVRRAAGIQAAERDYGQAAVVANFRCAKPHRNVAYQWFQGGPVLALLPLPGEQVSMVWSLPVAEAERIAAQPAIEVTQASHRVLGELALASAVKTFPLRRLSARRLVAPRIALAGDAAHVVHPLAGQGLNLGLRDARVLAETLAQRGAWRDCGDYTLLRRYERARKEDVLAMQLTTDGLQKLFMNDAVLLSGARNFGLVLADRLPFFKSFLVHHAVA